MFIPSAKGKKASDAATEFLILEGLDLEEYFIASKVKKFQNKTEDKTTIEVKKSTGIKCSLCWKILDQKCDRKYCGVN